MKKMTLIWNLKSVWPETVNYDKFLMRCFFIIFVNIALFMRGHDFVSLGIMRSYDSCRVPAARIVAISCIHAQMPSAAGA